MTKHILDRSMAPAKQRLQKALKFERTAGPRDTTLALQRRHRSRTPTNRLAQFLRVARNVQG